MPKMKCVNVFQIVQLELHETAAALLVACNAFLHRKKTWWIQHDVCYSVQAPALTLLLPLDSIGACGHRSRSLHIPPHGCSRRHILHSIYSFYQVCSTMLCSWFNSNYMLVLCQTQIGLMRVMCRLDLLVDCALQMGCPSYTNGVPK